MNSLTPALVTQKSAQRLPRLALLALCAAYLLPGLFGRDPWKNADISAFGFMLGIARGWASPFAPSVGGIPAETGGLLPYWLGAASIKLLPWLEPALAARLPFMLLLGGVLACTWYSCYYLARTEAAQPLPLAFGGDARPADYARAIADGALLALIASLGLLDLGHQTTPELMQLFGAALFLYAQSVVLTRPRAARFAALTALPIMAGSGSPTLACVLGAVALAIHLRSGYPAARSFTPWLAASVALAAGTALSMDAWVWRVGRDLPVAAILRSLTWFTWPAWPLAAWTLWRWRSYVARRHIAVPLGTALVGIGGCVAMSGSDRALLLSLPGLAVLAAFALPTLKRSFSAAIDWFTVFFFTAGAMGIWVVYAAMQTGVPAKTAANVAKLSPPDFKPQFSFWLLAVGVAASVCWIAVVRWRTSRQQHALWKSLVLPASGVALCWMLLMTLWLPLIDQARSYRSQINRVSRHLQGANCVAAPGVDVGLMTAVEYFAGLPVDGRPLAQSARRCTRLIATVAPRRTPPSLPGWQKLASERQRSVNTNQLVVYQRATLRPARPVRLAGDDQEADAEEAKLGGLHRIDAPSPAARRPTAR